MVLTGPLKSFILFTTVRCSGFNRPTEKMYQIITQPQPSSKPNRTLNVFLWCVKDFDKNPTGKEPRNLKLEAEVTSQKIALRSDSIKKIMNYKLIFPCKLLTVHKKSKIKQWNSIFLHYEHFRRIGQKNNYCH